LHAKPGFTIAQDSQSSLRALTVLIRLLRWRVHRSFGGIAAGGGFASDMFDAKQLGAKSAGLRESGLCVGVHSGSVARFPVQDSVVRRPDAAGRMAIPNARQGCSFLS